MPATTKGPDRYKGYPVPLTGHHRFELQATTTLARDSESYLLIIHSEREDYSMPVQVGYFPANITLPDYPDISPLRYNISLYAYIRRQQLKHMDTYRPDPPSNLDEAEVHKAGDLAELCSS